jgi:hypothetical protein
MTNSFPHEQLMQSVTNPFPNRPVNHPSYPPSVPLSVYRQLANELQAAQGKINQLGVTNQQISQENQVLRQEISKVLESVNKLQSLLDASTRDNLPPQVAVNTPRQNPKTVEKRVNYEVPPILRSRKPQPAPNYQPMSPTYYIEEQEVSYNYQSQSDAAEFTGWRLLIAIFLIIITAFGAGYLFVRPLLELRSR